MADPRPVRLQLSRRRGFNLAWLSAMTNGLPVVSVARPGKWGNPYAVGGVMNAVGAVALYRSHITEALAGQPTLRAELETLRGKNLACWCPPGAPCHADVLLELANPEAFDA